ncbi:DUF5696 domain-containing protein [Paenibacillus mendelii]|uniref:DUF5696 domain-containing protein n=1 Tax=Paenibacillus mendelii TaxID=206163 RepID=A0ABV6JFA6_9BACL|nr:DUF5696 domain-containing protein [Paenibacillus mendelii]MCQ6557466.1 DUF5696 domain-containing protein [Paenibacillus mendelii]
MVKWLPHTNRSRWLLLAAVVVVVSAMLLFLLPQKRLPSLDSLGLELAKPVLLPAWTEGGGLPKQARSDQEGYRLVLENQQFRLWLHPKTSQIAVEELATGLRWRSNPREADLAGETVKGLLLTNLKSTFTFEYSKDGKTQREIANTMNKNLEVDYHVEEGMVQATYRFTKLGLSIAIQYALNEHGLVVRIPSDGIVESGDRKLLTLNLLPYFGAAPVTSKEGYLFVPDGPGGLIYFNKERTVTEGKRYSQPIYGFETANRITSESQRELISYPVFGLKDGEQAYAAIIDKGEMTANIKAMPSGEVSTFHSANVEFIYRQEYGQRMSRLSAPVSMIQKERIERDRVVEYRLLSGKSAGYVGMAQAYRTYLLETQQLREPLAPAKNMPLELTLLGGNARKTAFGTSFIPVTTFSQASDIAKRFIEAGAADLRVTYSGWQAKGDYQADTAFTVASELGGSSGLSKLSEAFKEMGVTAFRLEADLVSMINSRTGALARAEGIRSIDGTVYYSNMGEFVLNPVKGVRQADAWWTAMSRLGVDGIYFDQMGRRVFRDYNNDQPLEREDTAYLYAGIFNHLKSEGVNVSARRTNAYALSGVDHIVNMPMSSSHDFIMDETVPFLPMAVHGYVTYSGPPGNMRDLFEEELLKAIEYGAIPSFLLTYEAPRLLKNTPTWGVYSSEFAVWEKRVQEEMAMFAQLAPVLNQEMIDHRRISKDVYVTTYADGTEVEVDYASGTFKVRGGSVH